jgi:hypothetical protein
MRANWWTIGWVLWIAWFAIQEGAALIGKREGATLSEHVWEWFNVFDKRPTALVVVGRGLLVILGIWLAGHFGFGWWTPTRPWPGIER